MTPKTRARRAALLDQVITDTALDYRFDEKHQPWTTEDCRAAVEEASSAWNRYADRIDKWAASPKFANGYIGLRAGWSIGTAGFGLTDAAERAGAKLPNAYWRAIGALDDLAEHIEKGATKLKVPLDRVQWMADWLFLFMIPRNLIEIAAHTKGHIWDRRLRHTKRAKARKQQAFLAEAQLVIEEARQEAEFQSLLRDVLRKDRKMRSDVRADRNYADFDFSTAPPDVRVVRLSDHKGFMLVPPRHGRAKPPTKTE